MNRRIRHTGSGSVCGTLHTGMAGHTAILQAPRKIPTAGLAASELEEFLPHQANGNLIAPVAGAVYAPVQRFCSDTARFDNASSSSMSIVAAEWSATNSLAAGSPAVFVAFGAGFHWGAIAAGGA